MVRYEAEFLRNLRERKDVVDFLSSSLPLDGIFELPSSINPERLGLFRSLYKGIGNTGIYKLALENENSLDIKLEYSNQMGNSHYARYWIIYLFIAELLEVLSPNNNHIIETTSGSSGIALSMAAEKLGYELTLVIPKELPEHRVEPMRKKGTNLVIVEGYLEKCVETMTKMIASGKYTPSNHSRERANIIVHTFRRIANEYIASDGIPDYAILALGNGSTVRAIGEEFKKLNNDCKLFTFEPDLYSHPVYLVYGLIPPCVQMPHAEAIGYLIERHLFVHPSMIGTMQEQYSNNDIICNFGDTSLQAIYFANQLAKQVSKMKMMVVAYDTRDRY